MNDIEQQRVHFESVANRYMESRQNANHLLLKNLIWSHFLRDKQWRRPLRVLEPMCGYAEGLKILEFHVGGLINYTGFDISQTLVEHVRRSRPDVNVRVQDVTSFEIGDDSYDLIILIGGLHHVYRHLDSVLDRLSMALAPGGYFINFEPTHNNVVFRYVRGRIYKKNSLFDSDTERGFDLRDYNHAFTSRSFEQVDQIYPGLLSYVLYYNPDAFPMLNIGGERLVRALFAVDQLFFRNWIGRSLSFATLSLWRKSEDL